MKLRVKLIFLTFLLTLVFPLLPAKPVSAANINCTITIDKTEVDPGENFEVTVSFSDGKPHSFRWDLLGTNWTGTKAPESNPYTFTLTAPNQYFDTIRISQVPRSPDQFTCTKQLLSSTEIPEGVCSFTIDPQFADPGDLVNFVIKNTKNGFTYTLKLGDKTKTVDGNGGTVGFLTLRAPNTAGDYPVSVQESNTRNSSYCEAETADKVTVTSTAPNTGGNVGEDKEVPGLGALFNPVKFTSIGEVISRGLPIIFGLVALLAVVVFAIGAFRYMVSRGDAKAADSARSTMTEAVIGLIIVLGAAATSSIFSSIFGLGLFGTGNRPEGPGTSGVVDLRCAFELTTGTCIGAQFGNFGQLFSLILLLILSVGALVFLFMMIWNGIRYMTARGDEKAVGEARSGLTSTFIGFLLIVTAIIIIRLVTTALFGKADLV